MVASLLHHSHADYARAGSSDLRSNPQTENRNKTVRAAVEVKTACFQVF